eukprot:10187_1
MVDPIGTCQALDLLTQDQLEQLFDESNGYLSKVDEIFDTVQHNESEEHTHHNDSSTTDSNPHMNEEDDADDAGGTIGDETIGKPHMRRQSSILSNKKCLILDVDNTLIYVRHFMDEMRVGDRVKLGDRDAIVTSITYRLDLELSDNPGQMSGYDHVLQNKDDSIPQRGEWFPDEASKVAIIHQADPTGCAIHLVTEEDDEEEEEEEEEETKTSDDIEISFLQNSDDLSQLEPMMKRSNYLSVTFMYGGYLVRIRPGLAQFLSLCNSKYDVILFTAADGSVYQGLLKQVHHILQQELSNNEDIDFDVANKLWDKVYFRNDCDEKLDEYGLPYRHKNLAKLGRDLSTIVMVDDNPLSYRGFEPNSVRVAGFWGLAHPSDNELMNTLFPTLWTIASHADVRYYLSGLGQPPDCHENESNKEDELSNDDLLSKQRRHSRQASVKFLQHLKEAIVAENESLEASSEEMIPEPTPEPVTSDDETHSLDSLSDKHAKDRTYEHKELDEIFNNTNHDHLNNDTFLDMFHKRPSVELDDVKKETNARNTAPNSPKDSKEEEEEEEEEELPDEVDNDGQYVLTLEKGQSGSVSISSTKRDDAQLLGDRERDTDHEILGPTGSRPSRTPTPLSEIEAEILIEKTQQSASCGCFGFFGKKNKKKNIGLAQQELR